MAVDVVVVLVIVVGLVGVVIPVLPGLVLVWAAIVGWALIEGGGWLRWAVVVVTGLIGVAGYVAATAVPGRRASGSGAPEWVVAVGLTGMVVGFFVVPVIGALVGMVVGVFAAELARTRDLRSAWQVTVETLKGFGIGVAIQLTAGLVMAAVWLVGVAAS